MDDVARATTREESDLAAIVLGRTQAGNRRMDAPERVPAWLDDAPARGYDARSVAVLALVVVVLAAVVGWATSIGDQPSASHVAKPSKPKAKAASSSPDDAFSKAFGSAATAVEKGSTTNAATSSAAAVVHGVDLTPGRVVASRSGSGSGLVAVSVRNAGDAATAAGSSTEVLVLVDGEVVGTGTFGALAPGETARVEVPLGWCPSGSVAVVAVIDPGSVAREGDERNNSLSRNASFGC